MKTYSSGQQEELEENEKEVLLKSCLNNTTDKFASNILSIECIKKNIIYHLSQEARQTAQHMNRRKHFYVSQLMEKKFKNLKDINWYAIVEELLTFFPRTVCVSIVHPTRATRNVILYSHTEGTSKTGNGLCNQHAGTK